jgi:hypothetical protein
MSENIPTNENKVEKIPNEREVLNIFDRITGGDFEITRSVEDEEGLSALNVIAMDENGEKVGYDYRRNDFNGETVIDVVFYDGDMPCGGYPIKKYEGGEWIEEGEVIELFETLLNVMAILKLKEKRMRQDRKLEVSSHDQVVLYKDGEWTDTTTEPMTPEESSKSEAISATVDTGTGYVVEVSAKLDEAAADRRIYTEELTGAAVMAGYEFLERDEEYRSLQLSKNGYKILVKCIDNDSEYEGKAKFAIKVELSFLENDGDDSLRELEPNEDTAAIYEEMGHLLNSIKGS